jgi:replication factor A1
LGIFSNDWAIKAKITKKGTVKKFQNKVKQCEGQLLPLEIVDEEGVQMTATLFGAAVDKYSPMLEEGKCYKFANGTVKAANKRYTSIQNDYTINLDDLSAIELVADDGKIKYKKFNFTSIEKISTVDNGTIVDVLGIILKVNDMSSITRKDGTSANKRVMTIYDESKQCIDLTLWGTHAEAKFSPKQIIAIKSVKVAEYNGKILNTAADTSFVVDPEDERVPELKQM